METADPALLIKSAKGPVGDVVLCELREVDGYFFETGTSALGQRTRRPGLSKRHLMGARRGRSSERQCGGWIKVSEVLLAGAVTGRRESEVPKSSC